MTKTSASERLDTFRAIPLFAGLSDTALRRIIKVASEFDAPAGQVLIQPGTAGSGMFVLEEGSVTVEQGSKKIKLGPGEFFGELSLLTDAVRNARVRAATDVRCVAIPRADFGKLLKEEPKIAVSMLGVLAARLEKATG
jgi:CRP/FNR family cyclic AMP-dependent transcriptional regulator